MRSVGSRATAILIGVVGALLLAEVGARLVLPAPERAAVIDSGYEARLHAENRNPKHLEVQGAVDDESAGGVLYFHTATGMRLRANTRARIDRHHLGGRTVEIRTNSLGYRGPELGEKTRPRVLFVGDSITVQDYLPEEETIVHLVETDSEKTDRPLETVNAGVGAIGLAAELAILTETGFAAEPDAVVLNWYLNDVQSSAGVAVVDVGWLSYSRLAELLASSIAGLRPTRRDVSTIPPELLEQWRIEVAARLPARPGHVVFEREAFNQKILDLFYDWGTAWSTGAWERMGPLIEEMKRQCDLHGVRFLIVAFPVLDQVTAQYVYDYPQKRLAGIAARLGVPMLDLLPLLRREYRRLGGRLYLDWCHPGPEASATIAQAILQFLQREI